jgi:hypothetical protein
MSLRDEVQKEWNHILAYPISFVISTIIAVLIMWSILDKLIYKTIINNYKSNIEMHEQTIANFHADIFNLKNQIDSMTKKDSNSTQTSTLNINGEWLYNAIANTGLFFSEDSCKERFGEVYICPQKIGWGINITGTRLVEAGCCCTPNLVKANKVNWRSDFATVSLNASQLYLWLKTFDATPRYAFISASIIKGIHDTVMQGDMYYLNEDKMTWLKANINFYRKDDESSNAKRIKNVLMNPKNWRSENQVHPTN